MNNISNFEKNITNLNLDTLSNLLKIISKQIIELGGNPSEIIKINISLVDLEKQRWINGVICPWCNNNGHWKNGLSKKDKTIQRYKCRKCKRTFDFMSGTFLSYSHLTIEQLTKLIQCIILKLSCKKTGEICSLSEQHSWKQRIKVLKIFDKMLKSELLTKTVWLDETYIPQNYKGNWKSNSSYSSLKYEVQLDWNNLNLIKEQKIFLNILKINYYQRNTDLCCECSYDQKNKLTYQNIKEIIKLTIFDYSWNNHLNINNSEVKSEEIQVN